jgi:hypothetical protein
MADGRLPWELAPEFTRDRLEFVARRLLEIRADAVRAQLPERGDTGWVLGCRAYEWGRQQLYGDMLAGQHPWLRAVPLRQLKFDLRIGGRPIHVFRGDAEAPGERHLIRGREKQGQFAFMNGSDDDGGAYYLAVETDSDGNGLRVVFFESNANGENRNEWVIPVEPPMSVAADVQSIAKEGKDLPEPMVAPKVPTWKRGDGDDEDGN